MGKAGSKYAKRGRKKGNTKKPERILVPDEFASYKKKCNRSARTRKDEMENRKGGGKETVQLT